MDLATLLGLRPFDRSRDKPVSLPGGSFATEYSATSQAPDGSWLVHPQIWWDPEGQPRYLDGDAGLEAAMIYEMAGNPAFPRFRSPEEADRWAASRSHNGGGQVGPMNALGALTRGR